MKQIMKQTMVLDMETIANKMIECYGGSIVGEKRMVGIVNDDIVYDNDVNDDVIIEYTPTMAIDKMTSKDERDFMKQYGYTKDYFDHYDQDDFWWFATSKLTQRYIDKQLNKDLNKLVKHLKKHYNVTTLN